MTVGGPGTVIILAGVLGASWVVSTPLAADLPRLLGAMGGAPPLPSLGADCRSVNPICNNDANWLALTI